MVGLFINTLPLRLSLSSEATIDSALKELQQQQLLLDEYAYTPLSRVQEWSEIPAGLPLFETVVVFENYPVDASLKEARGELKFGNVCSRGSTNYPLTLIVRPGPTLALQLSYDARRFDARMIDQLLRHLEHLLTGIASGPMQCVCDLHPLSQAERRQLLVECNGADTAPPRDHSLHQLSYEHAPKPPP